jgi:hypothetical protein
VKVKEHLKTLQAQMSSKEERKKLFEVEKMQDRLNIQKNL